MWNLSSNVQLSFDDVLIAPEYSEVLSRTNCSLDWDFGLRRFFSLPVMSSNMTTVTGLKMAKAMSNAGGLGVLHRFMSPEEQVSITNRFYKESPGGQVCNSVGALSNDKQRIDLLIECFPESALCVDLAHGHSLHMKETLGYIKNSNFKGSIMAGNVVTPAGAIDVAGWGATMIKVGIGPGSVCTTRVKTGVGWPQLSAVGNIRNALNDADLPVDICADGGIRTAGDAVKALAAGATTVMIGGMLAGTDCVPGWIKTQGLSGENLYLKHSGNASARVKHDFNQHNNNAEGVTLSVVKQPEGSTLAVLDNICEGICSAMSYVGALNLQKFYKKSRFIRVSNSTGKENTPHLNT